MYHFRIKLKVSHWKTQKKKKKRKRKLRSWHLVPSLQIDGETMEKVTDFILGGSKITADGDCSHEIKRRLLLGRKVMINLDSILKNRDITLRTKVCLVNAMVSLVIMYGCESWTINKVEYRRIDAFELWCWRRFLRVSWMPSNHLILCCHLFLPPSIFPSVRVFFKWVSSLHQVAKVLEFQLQHQSF